MEDTDWDMFNFGTEGALDSLFGANVGASDLMGNAGGSGGDTSFSRGTWTGRGVGKIPADIAVLGETGVDFSGTIGFCF